MTKKKDKLVDKINRELKKGLILETYDDTSDKTAKSSDKSSKSVESEKSSKYESKNKYKPQFPSSNNIKISSTSYTPSHQIYSSKKILLPIKPSGKRINFDTYFKYIRSRNNEVSGITISSSSKSSLKKPLRKSRTKISKTIRKVRN